MKYSKNYLLKYILIMLLMVLLLNCSKNRYGGETIINKYDKVKIVEYLDKNNILKREEFYPIGKDKYKKITIDYLDDNKNYKQEEFIYNNNKDNIFKSIDYYRNNKLIKSIVFYNKIFKKEKRYNKFEVIWGDNTNDYNKAIYYLDSKIIKVEEKK